MKKISYFDGCKKNYIDTLEIDNSIQTKWTNLKNTYSKELQILPFDIKEIIKASYKTLVEYFIEINKLKKTSVYTAIENEMKNIFVYDDYKGKIAKFFINNAEKMNIVSCYYCDASYSGIYRVNKNHGRTFDVEHFFPNDQYPLFSLSLFNFVPSCQVCNSRVKGTSIFMNFYNLNHLNEAELRQCLLEISPTSQLYNLDKNVNIKIYPNIHFYTNYRRSCFSKWNYNPLFYRAINSYELYFDINEITFYQKPIDAMHINQRYNNIAIKSQALYLMDLKRRYPDSYIKKLSSILSKYDETKKYSSFKDIKKALFHEDNKYDLLQKLRKDTINNYQI